MARPELISDPDELTPDWAAAVLGLDDIDVFEVEPLGGGVGFLGDLTRLRVGSGNRTDQVIVKLPPADPGGRAVGQMLDVWRREHLFYTDLAPKLPVRVPVCVHSSGDPMSGRWVLVLEDVWDATNPDQIAGGTIAQMEAAVDEAALLHGATWGGWVDEAPWMPGITAASAGGFGHVLRAAIGPFVERYGDRVPPRTIAWLAGFVEELGPWFSEVAGGPVTITHADYRLDNLLFEPNGRAVVLDWQTAMRSDPATDLAILLATSLTIEDRRRHEDALLERYRRRLAETGRDIGEERLRTGYRAAMLWWMAMFANNLSAIEPADDRGTSLFESMVERTFAAADDHESGQLIGRSLGS